MEDWKIKKYQRIKDTEFSGSKVPYFVPMMEDKKNSKEGV
jgi:hypothetical protein